MGAKVRTRGLREIRVDEAAEIWKAWECGASCVDRSGGRKPLRMHSLIQYTGTQVPVMTLEAPDLPLSPSIPLQTDQFAADLLETLSPKLFQTESLCWKVFTAFPP